jgi:hypothetical protein
VIICLIRSHHRLVRLIHGGFSVDAGGGRGRSPRDTPGRARRGGATSSGAAVSSQLLAAPASTGWGEGLERCR